MGPKGSGPEEDPQLTPPQSAPEPKSEPIKKNDQNRSAFLEHEKRLVIRRGTETPQQPQQEHQEAGVVTAAGMTGFAPVTVGAED